MIGELINVGTEILIGDTLNTNAQYISKGLSSIGFNVYYHTTVGDNPKRLYSTLKNSIKRSDIVIITGGLGPTQDDLTKETLAEVFKADMVFNQESYDALAKYFKNLNKVTENNFKQAYIPEGSIIIPNDNGTAPGIIMEKSETTVVLLPGPPSEMIPMFEDTVLPFLAKRTNIEFFSNYYKIISIGESTLEDMLIDLIDGQSNPTLATYAKPGEVMLRVTANASTREEAESLLQEYDVIIKDRLGDNIYAYSDVPLNEVVANALIQNNLTVSIAESCTGGLIASKLTEIPGISRSFHSGIISYANGAKQDFIGVSKRTLDKYGSVSEETAREMLEGLFEKTNTDIVVATTGIAGPSGGSEEKPVGLVYIGVLFNGKCTIERNLISGSRKRIQTKATNIALNMVRLSINSYLENRQ